MQFTSSNASAEVISAKRQQRTNALATAGDFIPQEHQQFLDATASEIVTRIQDGYWTASQVVEAYIARAAQVQAETNCLTEIIFQQARAEAKLLDAEFSSTRRIRGPLHGVPMSFKDHCDIANVDSSTGYTQWANDPAPSDALVVKALRAAGAIPIVKTNVPQTMLAFECSNPLWGCTTNPWSAAHTPGGSSGGEGALLSADGSAVGIGTDVGGSLRIPASYCGIFAFKPSVGRVASDGFRNPNAGFLPVQAVAGPMGRSVEDIEVLSRLMLGVQGPSHQIPPLPYRDIVLPPNLRFGYYTDDHFIKASPTCKRAVLETVKALRDAGHECVEFELPEPLRVLELYVGLTSADGYKTLLSHLGPDKKESSMFLVTLGPRLPGWVRSLACWAAETFMGDKIFANLLSHSRTKSVQELQRCIAQRDEYRNFWMREVWERREFDAIICPVQAVPAVAHGATSGLSPLANATILYNLIDSPVGVIPVTRVDPAKDGLTEEWTTKSSQGCKTFEDELYRKKGKYSFNPEAMQGLPVGIQVVGRKWEDEKVIAMMHVVDKALGPRDCGPGIWRPRSH